MLDFMRRQHSRLKWVWIIVIAVFSLSLVGFYIPFGDMGAVSLSGDVARIGSESISAREFEVTYTNYMRQMQGQLSPEVRRAFGFETQIIQYLVEQKVVMAEARRLGLQASPEDIQRKVFTNPTFLAGGSFIGFERYQAMLQQNNLTVDQFETAIANEVLAEKLHSFVTAGVDVNEKEIEDEFRKRNEKVQLTYFVVDPLRLESKVTLTDAEQREYYEKNKAKYNIPEKRKSKYVFVETLKYRVEAKADDAELQAYYDDHSEEYRLPEEVTAQHILFNTEGKTPEEVEAIRQKATGVLERAKNGEDFAKLAREFSDDGSAQLGGELGTFGRGRMVPEFEQAAFNMGVGAISDLVTTQFGFHIIKVNGKQEARLRSFEEMKEAVRPVVLFQKGEEAAKNAAETIAVELVNTTDLEAVAQKHGAAVKEAPLLEQAQMVPGFGNSTEYQTRVFTMTKDQIGTAIAVGDGFAIPQVTQIEPAHAASYEEALPRLVTDLRSEKALQLATETSNKLQEEIKAGRTDLAALARSAGEEIKTSEMLTRGGALPEFGALADRDDEIFSLAPGKVGTPASLAGKTLFFLVKSRQEINREEMQSSMTTLKAEILAGKRNRYFTAYIRDAQKRMEANNDITIDESAVSQIASRVP